MPTYEIKSEYTALNGWKHDTEEEEALQAIREHLDLAKLITADWCDRDELTSQLYVYASQEDHDKDDTGDYAVAVILDRALCECGREAHYEVSSSEPLCVQCA